ncbi:MAG: NADH-quinone oxidoreductase subunit NuoF [Reinekea sp.]|jgi:formate dehydrogenase iron-sulfur subunit
MSIRIHVPSDTTARSLGADRLAELIAQMAKEANIDLVIHRNGTRALYWLEPLIEVDTKEGRCGFGPVKAADLASLFAAEFWKGSNVDHPLALGLVKEIPYLKQQQRLTFSRSGVVDPLSLDDYRKYAGYRGLENAIKLGSQGIIDAIKESGLRGRGGGAFPTGIKWQTVHDAPSNDKYIVCNADEGDSGTFADRLVMECDPFVLIEGVTIAGLAVGATQGFIYLRSEYPQAYETLKAAIQTAYDNNLLGKNILGSGIDFDLEPRLGAGAYICGDETALLESLEGKRGIVRVKPPLPALEGFLGKPTVVNNVLSIAAVPFILDRGPQAYADYGMGRSRGTMPFQLAGNVKQGGLVELAFGPSLRELMFDYGGGTRNGRPLRAVQVGGPLGAYLPESQWDTPLDYEEFTKVGAVLGHGGVVMFDDSVDMSEQARFSMEFCVKESCGKCTPCRIGSTRGVEVIDRIRAGNKAGNNVDANLALLSDLCETMIDGSLCAMGGMTPFPVQSAVKHFAEDFVKDAASNPTFTEA